MPFCHGYPGTAILACATPDGPYFENLWFPSQVAILGGHPGQAAGKSMRGLAPVASRASQRRRILLSRSKLVQAVPSNQVGPSVKLAVIELKLYELTQANKRWPVEMQGFQGFQDFPGPVSKLPPASTCLVVAPSPPAHVCQHPCLGTAVHVNLHFDAARHQRL